MSLGFVAIQIGSFAVLETNNRSQLGNQSQPIVSAKSRRVVSPPDLAELVAGHDATATLQWRRTFDAIEDYVTILDCDQRIVLANQSLLEGLRVDLDKIIGCKCHQAFWGKAEDCPVCPVEKVLRDRCSHTIEVVNRRLGKIFAITASPIMADDGRVVGMVHVTRDITDRKRAEEELVKARAELEERVLARTRELTRLNQRLQSEIAERRKAEDDLLRRTEELDLKTRTLEEANVALRVILKTREEDKHELEEKVMANLKNLVRPYLEKMSSCRLDREAASHLQGLRSSLDELVSSFARDLTAPALNLTPREIQIAGLIKEGRTSKEIAGFMNVSPRTVEFHRENIRKKIGLVNRKVNLRSQLLLY